MTRKRTAGNLETDRIMACIHMVQPTDDPVDPMNAAPCVFTQAAAVDRFQTDRASQR